MDENINPVSGLTAKELAISEMIVTLWNQWRHDFAKTASADEIERFRDGLHQVQQVLADRALHRAYPDYWK